MGSRPAKAQALTPNEVQPPGIPNIAAANADEVQLPGIPNVVQNAAKGDEVQSPGISNMIQNAAKIVQNEGKTESKDNINSSAKNNMETSIISNPEKTDPPITIVVTDDELGERIAKTKGMLDALKECYSPETHRTDEGVRRNLICVKQMYFKFKDVTPERALSSRRLIGTHMVERGIVPILCEIVVDYLSKGWLNDEGQVDVKVYYRFYNAFVLLLNYSDSTPAISSAAADVPGFFEVMGEKLKSYYGISMGEAGLSKIEEAVVRSMLGFTHNCSSVPTARTRLREIGFTAILIPYLEAKTERFKMSSILSLANIVNEEECGLINTSVKAVRFLLKSLGKAIKDELRRCTGWSAKELALGVGRLATNDSNKKMLVNEGALPLLVELSKVECVEDQAEAVGAMWALSFDDENKDKMIIEPGLITRLEELCKSSDKEVRKSSQGVLWTLRYKLKETPEHKQLGENLCGTNAGQLKETDDTASLTRHVMISYQWDCQKLLISVAEALKSRGFKTWMDVDNMGGSTLQAMAEAVENSAVVLVCMSQPYKDSPNCRAEAEYAFQRRVPIVPLLMERGYKPDGWLGMILGAKLFFEFSGKYSFDSKMDGLVKELGDKGRAARDAGGNIRQSGDTVDGGPPDVIVPAIASTVSSRPPPNKRDEVRQWEKHHIEKWLEDSQLNSPALKTLTGEQLIFLRNMKVEAPETFYSLLRKNLGLKSVESLMAFVQALTDLL